MFLNTWRVYISEFLCVCETHWGAAGVCRDNDSEVCISEIGR